MVVSLFFIMGRHKNRFKIVNVYFLYFLLLLDGARFPYSVQCGAARTGQNIFLIPFFVVVVL